MTVAEEIIVLLLLYAIILNNPVFPTFHHLCSPIFIENEERYKAVGISVYLRELLVVYCIREKIADEKITRIISARKANAEERRKYYERQL